MMYLKCPTCKHMLGHLQVTYDKQLYDIVNNPNSLDDDINVSALVAALYIIDRVPKGTNPSAHPGFFYAAKNAVGKKSWLGKKHSEESKIKISNTLKHKNYLRSIKAKNSLLRLESFKKAPRITLLIILESRSLTPRHCIQK